MADASGTSPQFDTAQYSSQPANSCGFCGVPLKSSYYRMNGKMSCENCAKRIEAALPQDSGATFLRSIALGLVGCLLGLTLYAAVAIATGRIFGLISLAVGFIVAKLMMVGSKGIGGRRYQVAAVVLTYLAISLSFIPLLISEYIKNPKVFQQAVSKPSPKPAPEAAAPAADAPPSTAAQDAVAPAQQSSDAAAPATTEPAPAPVKIAPKKKDLLTVVIGFGALFVLGLISPFLELADPFHGLIGLLIIFFGLQIAWRLAAGVPRATVEGPYTV